MENLAGVDEAISTPLIIVELVRAGIPVLLTTFRKRGPPEVKAPVVGVLAFADGTIVAFSRLWYYSAHTKKQDSFQVRCKEMLLC
ncbi:MAG: hypothetical protein UY76_C0026G0009, partial [Candidatus Uhrbacteria bacterium GW2011_GWA2_52_8d]